MQVPLQTDLTEDARRLLADLRNSKLMIATAESCTGGLISATLTEIAGSSDVFERGFVTYSNRAKCELLGVPPALIDQHGAVSEQVAGAMAEGALAHSAADIAVAVTGIAGPSGGTGEKPVGLVHIAAMRKGNASVHQRCEFGDAGRAGIRLLTVAEAFRLIRTVI